MQAIILAGGLGTRLRSVVSDRPKPMALVEGKPFLEYVLQGLKKSGIDDIIFAVGYKGGMVEEYFGDGSRFGIRARYAYEEELLGTAGAIKNAGKYVTDEQFFVLNGDTFYQMDFGDLSRIQQEKNLEMALYDNKVQNKVAGKGKKNEAEAGAVVEQIGQREEQLTDDLELVAVISAAVAASTGASADSFVVRSIRRR